MTLASRSGQNEIVELLLQLGADWNINTNNGKAVIDLGILRTIDT